MAPASDTISDNQPTDHNIYDIYNDIKYLIFIMIFSILIFIQFYFYFEESPKQNRNQHLGPLPRSHGGYGYHDDGKTFRLRHAAQFGLTRTFRVIGHVAVFFPPFPMEENETNHLTVNERNRRKQELKYEKARQAAHVELKVTFT